MKYGRQNNQIRFHLDYAKYDIPSAGSARLFGGKRVVEYIAEQKYARADINRDGTRQDGKDIHGHETGGHHPSNSKPPEPYQPEIMLYKGLTRALTWFVGNLSHHTELCCHSFPPAPLSTKPALCGAARPPTQITPANGLDTFIILVILNRNGKNARKILISEKQMDSRRSAPSHISP
jgi:hypothetical protein